MCAVRECGFDTQRFFFSNTAVAARKIAMYQSQSAKNVCATKAQSRDLNFVLWAKTIAKVLTTEILL